MDRADNMSAYLGIKLTKSKDMLLFSVVKKKSDKYFWYFEFWLLFHF